MVNLSKRFLETEIMDQPGLGASDHREALAGLARINGVSRSAAQLWSRLRRRFPRPDRPLRVLDVASGGGDVAIGLWRAARRAGRQLEICGVDLSPLAVAEARRRAAEAEAPIGFRVLDVVRDPCPAGFDAAVSSLFLHHLDDDSAVTVLRKMAVAAPRLVVISDLRRSWSAWIAAHVACRLLTRSYVVRADGPHSVRAAFTLAELRSLFERAGLPRPRIGRQWPFRWMAEWTPHA